MENSDVYQVQSRRRRRHGTRSSGFRSKLSSRTHCAHRSAMIVVEDRGLVGVCDCCDVSEQRSVKKSGWITESDYLREPHIFKAFQY